MIKKAARPTRRSFLTAAAMAAVAGVGSRLGRAASVLSASRKPTDIRIERVTFGFEDHLYRSPVKFAGALMDPAMYKGGSIGTKGKMDAYIKGLEEKLSSVGDDAQLANVDLQNILQKQQQTIQLMSNISKMLHDTGMAIVRKIGG